MTLKFCQKCKALLSPHKTNREIFLKCVSCGFEDFSQLTSSEKIEKPNELGKGIILNQNTFANYLNKCKKCGYDKAEIIDMGIFYSDEDNLILLKCGKCGFSERIGRKTS